MCALGSPHTLEPIKAGVQAMLTKFVWRLNMYVQFTYVFMFICIVHLHMQGGLVLRKGAYRSEHDTFMEVDGVYVTATGQLQAVLKPVDRVKLNLEQQDFDLQTADYR